MADCLRLPVHEGIRRAAALGAEGVQVWTTAGEMAPEKLDAAARREFRRFCAGLKLEIPALCGDLGGHGFQRVEENRQKILRTKLILDLAADLGTRVVTTHIGVVPAQRANPTYQTLCAACRELGDYAHQRCVTLAIETGPEPAAVLKDFLADAGSLGLSVNLDPANLVMVVADDPVAAVHTLRGHIVHTHAKDGVQLKPCDPVAVYDAFAAGKSPGPVFKEVPLGEGGVPWDRYLAALKETGYQGYLTIECEVGADPEKDIREAVGFLKAYLQRLTLTS